MVSVFLLKNVPRIDTKVEYSEFSELSDIGGFSFKFSMKRDLSLSFSLINISYLIEFDL